jgi:hypothetical protein
MEVKLLDKSIIYWVLLGLFSIIILFFLYFEKDRIITTNKIKRLAKRFNEGKSENSDKKYWELNLGKLAGISGGERAVDNFYPVYKAFMSKHYPGIKPNLTTLDPEYWEEFEKNIK